MSHSKQRCVELILMIYGFVFFKLHNVPVQLWEAQKIKQVSDSPVVSYSSSTALPCIQVSGLLAA